MRKFGNVVGLISAVLLCLTFVPALHRSLETFSMLLPIFGGGCAVGLVATKMRAVRWVYGTLVILCASTVYVSFPDEQIKGDLRIYSKNVRYDNGMTKPLWADIEAANVDVVMLQEISLKNVDLLGMLYPTFPHQHLCKTASGSNVAIASKHPFTQPPRCSPDRAIVMTSISLNRNQVWIGSVHAPWPWPKPNAAAEQQMYDLLSTLQGPVVLAGDFNTMPWSAQLKRIKTLTKTRAGGPVRLTLRHAKLPISLPLDYAFSPGGGSVTARPLFGSDHLGIVADLGLAAD